MAKKTTHQPPRRGDSILAQNIRRLLTLRGLSMREASIRAGLGHGAVHDLLSAPNKNPRHGTIVALAAVLGVLPSQLTDGPLTESAMDPQDQPGGTAATEPRLDDDLFFESVADVLTCILEEGVPIDPAEIAIAALTIYREEAQKEGGRPGHAAANHAGRRERVRQASRTLIKTQKALDAIRSRHGAPQKAE